jgi:transposase
MNSFKVESAKYLKIRYPIRDQIEMQVSCLNDRLPPNHKARRVWEFVEAMDTNPLFDGIKSLKGGVGRYATDPKVFLTLWLYGLTEGVSSASKIATLTKEHDAYRWISGGTGVNHDNLSEFRSTNLPIFHKLLTNSLAVLVKAEVLTEEDFAQDGTRIKTAAGFNTFRGESTLTELLKEAEKYVKEVDKIDPRSMEKQVLSARKRAAAEKKNRLEHAVQELHIHQENLKKNRKQRNKGEMSSKELAGVRASYVDPEARKMKMGDGGFRIAYNIQFATGLQSRVIYGISVGKTQDQGTLGPMVLQLMSRLNDLGLPPVRNIVADSAYSKSGDLEQVAGIAPNVVVTAPSKVKTDPKKHRKGDSDVIKCWRDRLETDEFKELYQQRPSVAEFSIMMTKTRGMTEFLVRGSRKVFNMTVLYAISHNMARLWDLSAN